MAKSEDPGAKGFPREPDLIPISSAASQPSTFPERLHDGHSSNPRTLNSADLLRGDQEVLIQHDEKTYRLRVTRNGKLILVK